MSQDDKKDARTALRLLEYVADADVTAEEARAELAADGIDVEADIKDALAVVAAAKKKARLAAWKDVALEKARKFRESPSRVDYSKVPRAELIVRAQARPMVAHFRNFEELTDEDLRTLLADADELEDGDDESP